VKKSPVIGMSTLSTKMPALPDGKWRWRITEGRDHGASQGHVYNVMLEKDEGDFWHPVGTHSVTQYESLITEVDFSQAADIVLRNYLAFEKQKALLEGVVGVVAPTPAVTKHHT
jgi:hypothetical protein